MSNIRRSLIASFVSCFVTLFSITACRESTKEPVAEPLFDLLSANESGVNFINRITPDERINILTYEYLYNGAGVGVGDFNNDGYHDIFFAGSQVPGKLYLNNGKITKEANHFSFRDASLGSGISRDGNWAFGVSVVDINQDGFQDIYISMGGPGNMNSFPNKLFVHQGLDGSGNPVFREMAEEYGLADRAQSIHALFFDYDRDGDLDMYLLTGGGFEKSPNNPGPIVKDGSAVNTDRLFRNDYDSSVGHAVFTNVSKQAGIVHEGYGLGVSLADINEDGWPDIYVSNDYLTNDHLYINNRNGTFSEEVNQYFKHTSHFAMGNDVGDINNDGLMDVITVDMLPDDHGRRKLMFGPTQYNKFYYSVNHGYSHQYMRNTLQLNNGDGSFSEIGQLAGIYKTDWSWSVLLADFDNDAFQDVFITNGFGKDVTDLDFVKFRSSMTSEIKNESLRRKVLLDSLAQRPGIKVPNYAFRNEGNLSFEDVSRNWGFQLPTYSNGAAYADFDNDGDLDLVVSNLDEEAHLYRNTSRDKDSSSNFLRVKLTSAGKNRSCIGSKVTLRTAGQVQSKLNSPVHGFQSSMEDILHFGLSEAQQVDTLEVLWPDGQVSYVMDVKANQLLVLADSMKKIHVTKKPTSRIFEHAPPGAISYRHVENPFIDFNHEPLLPHKLSQEGPGIAVADINGDGLEDFYVGGALLKPGRIFVQKRDGTFDSRDLAPEDRESEDMGCLFFDADGDNDSDLYVVSGGNEYNPDHRHYQDRLYLNDGKGNFIKSQNALPSTRASGSCVVAADYDHDGDLDLFVGGRVLPTGFPVAPRSYLLTNNGKGEFSDATPQLAPALQQPGMVTSALWTDFDLDTWPDLVVVGEYMPITFFRNAEGRGFAEVTGSGLEETHGWWNSITAGDFDNDGDIDYLAGNFGLNSHFKASATEPISVAFKDFDGNGALEAITSYYEEGVNYPTASLDVLASQLPVIKRKILFHRTYANTTTDRLLEIAGSKPSGIRYCKTLSSGYVENKGSGKFQFKPFQIMMQTAPVYGIATEDIDHDGNLDFIAVGNSYAPEVVGGRCDAFIGQVMLGDGRGSFAPLGVTRSGFSVDGDAKGIATLISRGEKLHLVAQNNDSLRVLHRTERDKMSVFKLEPSEVTAVLTLSTGQSRRAEIGYGTTYLSQSSRCIPVTPDIKKITLFNHSGTATREGTFREGKFQVRRATPSM